MIWYICFFFALYLYWTIVDIIVETGSSMTKRTVAEKEDKFN
ncbi:hypothetical protein P8815_18150 [Bacillus altitudinis]|nr:MULTISPECIES: hypothetical protein [Bacillus]EIL83365.1 hypothetical protein BAME_34290 [Bacillus sp. M 2-6]MEC0473663.1 hypothetical protein [Bacillus altitudinis]